MFIVCYSVLQVCIVLSGTLELLEKRRYIKILIILILVVVDVDVVVNNNIIIYSFHAIPSHSLCGLMQNQLCRTAQYGGEYVGEKLRV